MYFAIKDFYIGSWEDAVDDGVGPPKDGPAGGTLRNLRAIWTTIRADLEKFEDERRAAQKDATLSPIGQQQKLTTAAKRCLQTLAERGTLLEKQKTYPATIEAALNKVDAGEPDVAATIVRELRAREIRDRIADLEPGKSRLEYVVKAQSAGDEETLRAVIGAPKSFPLVPANLREQIEREWLEARNPAAYAQLATLREAFAAVEQTLANAIAYVRTYLAPRERVASHLEGVVQPSLSGSEAK